VSVEARAIVLEAAAVAAQVGVLGEFVETCELLLDTAQIAQDAQSLGVDDELIQGAVDAVLGHVRERWGLSP
jgi:hypothetical protein